LSSIGVTKNLDQETIVQRQLDAYNRQDLAAFCACFHDEVEVRSLTTDKTSFKGMEVFQQNYQTLFATYPEQVCHLKSRIIRDDAVLDEEIVMGRSSHPDGKHVVAIYAFRDGVIDRVWFI
jgi:hypothetical protein